VRLGHGLVGHLPVEDVHAPPECRIARHRFGEAVIGDRLYIRASVKLQDLGGTAVLGPLAGMLGDREQMQFGGTFHVIRPQLAEYEVKDIKVRDLSLPSSMIPRVLRQTERGSRPDGLSEDGLPIVVPRYLGDVRIANGRVTLYKTAPK